MFEDRQGKNVIDALRQKGKVMDVANHIDIRSERDIHADNAGIIKCHVACPYFDHNLIVETTAV